MGRMDQDIRYGMEHFDRVWSRVTDTETPPAASGWDEQAALRGFMDDEARDRAFYTALAGRCPAGGNALRCMAADERGHLRELQVEYFLLTGESYAPPESCPVVNGTLSAMRKAHAGETAGSEEYRRAASRTPSPRLRALYESHAADEAMHAEKLRALILRAMG